MEKTIELTKQMFSNEFLKLCPKVNELSEALWFIFKMGGSVPTKIILARFSGFSSDMKYLTDARIIEVKDGTCMFTEDFEEKVLRGGFEANLNKITNVVVNNYSNGLIKNFGLENFVNSLATVLSTVIHFSTPEQPTFLNKILRHSAVDEPRLVLDCYLSRCLELVQLSSYGVNLSDKAKELLKSSPELWNIYSKKLKK